MLVIDDVKGPVVNQDNSSSTNPFKPTGVKWLHFEVFKARSLWFKAIAYWSNPLFLIFLTFGHSGAQG